MSRLCERTVRTLAPASAEASLSLRCRTERHLLRVAKTTTVAHTELGREGSGALSMRTIDVVVVAYRSSQHLRASVESLCGPDDIRVVVVDNACPEASTSSLAGLDVEVVRMGRNAGFGAACNTGAGIGRGSSILFSIPMRQFLLPTYASLPPESIRTPAVAPSAPESSIPQARPISQCAGIPGCFRLSAKPSSSITWRAGRCGRPRRFEPGTSILARRSG